MKVEELRRGNLVKTNQGVFKVHLIGEKYIQICPFLEKEPFKVKIWEPIPLTEEWLLKFGFEKNVYGYRLCVNDDFLSTLEYDEKDQYCYLDFEGTRNSIKLFYVHKLQNLYFCLTGEELTLNK